MEMVGRTDDVVYRPLLFNESAPSRSDSGFQEEKLESSSQSGLGGWMAHCLSSPLSRSIVRFSLSYLHFESSPFTTLDGRPLDIVYTLVLICRARA